MENNITNSDDSKTIPPNPNADLNVTKTNASPYSNTEIIEIQKSIDEFKSIDCSTFSDSCDWIKMFNQYQKIMNRIESYSKSNDTNKDVIKNNLDCLLADLSLAYDKYNRKFNTYQAQHFSELEEKLNKQQSLNFTVFSLFMTLLTFLLANVDGIKKNFELKEVLLLNFTILSVACVVFMFIGIFMDYIKVNDNKTGLKRYSKHILLCAFFLLVLIGIILIATLM